MVSSGDLVGEGSVITWGWISVEGGGAMDLGEGRVLEMTITCLIGGLEGGEEMTLVCSDSTYHLGLGRVGVGSWSLLMVNWASQELVLGF